MPRRSSPSGDPRDVQSLINSFFRLNPAAQLLVVILLAVAAFLAIAWWQRQHQPASPPGRQGISGPVDMLLGNPSGATADASNKDNYLMLKPYYALSYNNSKGTPNWVSWRVTRMDLGSAPRKPTFDPDHTLPPGFNIVTHKDYSGSGFDRGHMCPHADRAATQEMAWSTFIMTNIIPQAPSVNEKAWAQMESYCRELVRHQNRLYVIAGPAGVGGIGIHGPRDSIAHGKVTVPAQCWKIVVVVPESGGDDDLAKISLGTRVISVEMPNDNDQVGEEWAKYRTTPAQIQQRTGFHFFDTLSPDIAQGLKDKRDDTSIPPPRPLGRGKD